ncbi:MAG: radical SAM protein [Candidatus Omnitrophota bacterium]
MIKPKFGCIGITEECMLRCKMCYKWQDDIFIKKSDINTFPTVEQYMAFFKSLSEIVDKDFVLNFGGGETLLFPQICEVLKAAFECGLWTNLNSNGYLINEDFARRLGQTGLFSINLSLDSINPVTHDYLRGVDGVYKRTLQAIDNLHKFAPNVEIDLISVIYEQNYREFIPLMEWINHNEKIKQVLVMMPMQPNNTIPEERWWEGKYGFLWPKDIKKALNLVNELIQMKKNSYKISNSIAQLKAAYNYFANPERFVKSTVCNMYKAIHISSIGEIYICFEYGVLGNIKNNGDIKSILSSQKAELVRAKIKNCKKNCHFLMNCYFEEDEKTG